MIGALRESNFELLSEFAETARSIEEEARQALEQHTAEHGC
jgi:hypothetical protein